jgi:hypothetical protein
MTTSPYLTAENAHIFRITHYSNVSWALEHGLQCPSSDIRDPNFRNIGRLDIIDHRKLFAVPHPAGGSLSDYVPFYFTSHSPMAYNIHTGFRVTRVPDEEIVVFCARLRALKGQGLSCLFTDGHALATQTTFYDDLEQLDQIDWKILQQRDFKRDNEDPDKVSRYEAEALIRGSLPCKHLSGIACYNESAAVKIRQRVEQLGLEIKVSAWPAGYFT